MLSLPTFTLGRGLSAQQLVSLCHVPRLVASLGPGVAPHVLLFHLLPGAQAWWEQERDEDCLGCKLAQPCPAGANGDITFRSGFPSRAVKMLLQGRGISPSAWGEILFC